MTPLAFFRGAEVRRLLERAAEAAGMPLSLHYVEHGEEGPKMAAWGGCATCAYVAGLPEGKRACRESRLAASLDALAQGRGLPFLCHMGFACVAAPALPEKSYVLSLGPYAPAGAAESLAFDVLRGMEALTGKQMEELPFALDDIHRVPVSAPPALLAWLTDALNDLWNARTLADSEETGTSDSDSDSALPSKPHSPRRKRPARNAPSAYAAAEIAAAVAAGDQPLSRELLAGVLAEGRAQARRRQAVLRGRTIAAVGAILEALENTGVETASGWEALPQLAAAVQESKTQGEMLDAAMMVLGPLRRKAVKQTTRAMDYEALNAIVNDRLYEGVTLEEAAHLLGETATAVSHRLRRKFGMSYSEYVGRLRISKAKELLRRTRLSGTEVAERVGIRDQSNFTKLFKRYEGVTPAEYRERLRKRP